MRRNIGRLHVISAWLLVAGILGQALLAGLALRNLGGTGDFGLHVELGYTLIGLLALAVVLTAVGAGRERRSTLIALGLLLLYFVQTALPALREVLPAMAALHVVNALVMFALASWFALRAGRALWSVDRPA